MNTSQNDLIDATFVRRIIDIVSQVRDQLRKEYDISNHPDNYYRNYRGLCDTASKMIIDRVRKIDGYSLDVHGHHGEQRHTLQLSSKNWYYQHTWVSITFKGTGQCLYVDATCGQFDDIYDDIPAIYVSDIPPRWFMPDGKNLYWKCDNERIRSYWQAVIRFFEKIHAAINDIIRWMLGKV